MENNPKLSIIVPIYNAEKYIDNCMRSIYAQSFSDYEIILVNDGSADNSAAICREYQKKDSRVTYIEKENGGAGSARNAGMDAARGEYLAFPDVDDSFEPEMYAELYALAESGDYDVVFSGVKYYTQLDDGSLSYSRTQNIKALTYTDRKQCRDNIMEFFPTTTIFDVPWNKLYKWNISFRPNWSFGTNDGTGNSTSATFNADPYDIVNEQITSAVISELLKNTNSNGDDILSKLRSIAVNGSANKSLTYGENKRLGGTLQINRLLNGRGRNITLQLTGNYSDNENQQLSNNFTRLFKSTTTFNGVSGLDNYQTNRYTLAPTKSYDYSARATYSEPIAYATFLQFSYTFQYRYNENDRKTFDYSDPLLNDPTRGFDWTGVYPSYRTWSDYFDIIQNGYSPSAGDAYYTKDQSRYSAYKNYIHTGEVMLRFIRNTYDFNVGVQVIPQTSEYTQRYLGVDTVVNRSVINWSPTANFRWRFSQQGNLRFEYRGSTSQPSIDQLLVINDDTNPLNKTTGNPDLKPSFTQSFGLRYNDYFQEHQRFIFANLNFSTTANSIANKVTYDPNTGGQSSRPENINGNWNAGGNITFNSAIDSLGYFSYNISLQENFNHRVGYVVKDKESVRNITNSHNMGGRLGTSYRNDWLEVEVNGSLNYNYTRNELQPQSNLDTYTFSYGFNTTLQMPWGSQVTTDMSMNSRRGYTDASMNTNELIWNAQISHSLLRGKL